jgi:hypothetical protein
MKKSMCNRTAFSVISVLFLSLQVSATESDTSSTKKPTLQYGFIGIGAAWVDDSKLNDMLATMGISSFKDNALSLSIGKHDEYGRMIREGAVSGSFREENKNGNLRTSLWGADAVFNVGCNMLPGDLPGRLFPFVGVGLAGNFITMRADAKTLPELLASNEPKANLWQGAILFNAGIGSDFVIAAPGKKSCFAMGVRAGYRYDLYTSKNWYSDGTTVTGIPQLRNNGGYIRLIFGGWDDKHMKKHCCSSDCSKE